MSCCPIFWWKWVMSVNRSSRQPNRWDANAARPDSDLSNPTPIQSRRPYQNVGFVSGNTSGAWSNYNALTFRVEKRFSQGIVRAWVPTLGQRRWALGLGTTGP